MAADFFTGVVRFNAQTAGRDKLCRLCQYGSKFVWWNLQKSGQSEELVKKLKSLESSVSTTRKLLRFGKSIDFIQAALKSIHISNTVWRLTITLSKINQACYLLFDHIIYAGRIGLANIDGRKWKDLSARFWLVSLILNLIRDFYDIYNIFLHEVKLRNSKLNRSLYKNGDSDHKDKQKKILKNSELVRKCVIENKAVCLDLVKNSCDILLPLNSLSKISISPGTQGLVGAISSLIGIAATWNPILRLVPS